MLLNDSFWGKDFVENNPSQLIDVNSMALKDVKKYTDPPNLPSEDDDDLIESSPFEWDPEKGFIVPGEDEAFLAGKMSPEQIKQLKTNVKPQRVGPSKRVELGEDFETISTDSVDDRFDNI